IEVVDLAGTRQMRVGRVAWCDHVQGRVHGLGIRFDRPLDMKGFSQEAADAAARDALPQLDARILYVDADSGHRATVRSQLSSAGEQMVVAATVGAIPAMAGDLAVGLVLLSAALGPHAQTVEVRLRRDGLTMPVVTAAPDVDLYEVLAP